VLIADGSGRGTCLPIVDAGLTLPVENEVIAADSRRFFCVDPRDGMAVFQFTKPRKVGLHQPTDERSTLCSLNLPIDPGARPFLERLECQVQIDHDYVAHVSLISKLRGEAVKAEFHDLDFGLALPEGGTGTKAYKKGENLSHKDGQNEKSTKSRRAADVAIVSANVALRSNVLEFENWTLVPGDIVEVWKPNFLVADSREPPEFQRDEKMYYAKCVFCRRTIYEISEQGPVDDCRRHRCGEEKRSILPHREAAMIAPVVSDHALDGH